jgi:hypothetical protein
MRKLDRMHIVFIDLSQSKSCYDRQSVSQSVCLGVKFTLELVIRYYIV